MNTNHQTLPPLVDRNLVVTNALECVVELTKVWGGARLALVLSDAYFQGRPLTTDELADACQQSTETVRRNLKPLINIGRVRVLKEGRNIRYKAKADWAQWTCNRLLAVVEKSRVN